MASQEQENNKPQQRKSQSKARKPRNSKGQFDSPKAEIARALPKTITSKITKRIDSPSDANKNAGKYGKKEKITPSDGGGVRTIYH